MNHAEIEGVRIAYSRKRPPRRASGKRVIYIHGTGCDGRVFERHMEIVSSKHEVVAIDLPGHGGSEGTGFRGVADYAYFVASLIEALGWERSIVAGHSLGGGVALATALYCSALVEGLMLIDTGARLRVDPSILQHAHRLAAGEPVSTKNPRRGFAKGTPNAVIETIDQIRETCSPKVIYKDWVADDSCDFMSRLPHIGVPALAICGDEDEFTPVKYHEYFRDRLPNCQLEIIKGAGHWPFIEQPEEFDHGILNFLDNL